MVIYYLFIQFNDIGQIFLNTWNQPYIEHDTVSSEGNHYMAIKQLTRNCASTENQWMHWLVAQGGRVLPLLATMTFLIGRYSPLLGAEWADRENRHALRTARRPRPPRTAPFHSMLGEQEVQSAMWALHKSSQTTLVRWALSLSYGPELNKTTRVPIVVK